MMKYIHIYIGAGKPSRTIHGDSRLKMPDLKQQKVKVDTLQLEYV